MLYCPNCSAYQYDPEAVTCPKCGFDLSSIKKKENDPIMDDVEKKEDKGGNFSPRRPCRRCGAPTRDVNGEVEIEVSGTRMSISGLKLMGGEITKKPITRYTYHIEGYECREGHKFFSDFRCRVRPLCPVCYDPMMKYGAALMSCTRCNKHFPVENWVDLDELKVLLDHGWAPVPE